MKTKKIVKNLSLSKKTISNLSNLEWVKGGGPTSPTVSAQCQTFDLSNCETWEFPICKRCPTGASVCLPCN